MEEVHPDALLDAALTGADEDLRDAAFEYAQIVDPDKPASSQDEIDDRLVLLRAAALQFAALIFAQRRG
jgi:hypothetical protein